LTPLDSYRDGYSIEQEVTDVNYLILFHPYDRWGFATMDAATDDCYLRYVVARLAAYRNVWWSMANEYDLMPNKSMADWERFFRMVQEHDPYGHLRSVHNCFAFYDHSKPWVTHQSIQHGDLEQTRVWRAGAQASGGRRVLLRGHYLAELGQHRGAGDGPPLLVRDSTWRVRRSRRDL
jgi:hypothetical protein